MKHTARKENKINIAQTKRPFKCITWICGIIIALSFMVLLGTAGTIEFKEISFEQALFRSSFAVLGLVCGILGSAWTNKQIDYLNKLN